MKTIAELRATITRTQGRGIWRTDYLRFTFGNPADCRAIAAIPELLAVMEILERQRADWRNIDTIFNYVAAAKEMNDAYLAARAALGLEEGK